MYFAFIPAFSKRCRSNGVVLGFMNSFAGGVFLAMAFIHILPEAAEQYNEEMTKSITEGKRMRLLGDESPAVEAG